MSKTFSTIIAVLAIANIATYEYNLWRDKKIHAAKRAAREAK